MICEVLVADGDVLRLHHPVSQCQICPRFILSAISPVRTYTYPGPPSPLFSKDVLSFHQDNRNRAFQDIDSKGLKRKIFHLKELASMFFAKFP